MAETIALVACVKKKKTSPTAAKVLYISDLFGKSRAFAERFADRWFILSAKYGLVRPEEVIEPYEQTLKGAGITIRRAWAQRVYGQLQSAGALESGVSFLWLAGKDYQQPLSSMLDSFEQHDPLAGLSFGPRKRWLKLRLGSLRAADSSALSELPKTADGGSAEAGRALCRTTRRAGMTREQVVVEFLRKYKGQAFCDACLSEVLRIVPRQQVQQKTSRLARRDDINRNRGVCSRCRATRKVISVHQ